MANWTCSTCSQENPLRRQTCRECGRLLTETAAVQPGKAHVAPAAGLAPDAAAQPGPAEGERRLVTAVFADLSGYMTLAERLDPEELVDVVDPLISALTDIVGRFEGHVDKFAGDAVLCLFGAPVAHEDDPERALLAALEMQRELARLVRELPPEDRDLTLHIRVNTGHGVARRDPGGGRGARAMIGRSRLGSPRKSGSGPSAGGCAGSRPAVPRTGQACRIRPTLDFSGTRRGLRGTPLPSPPGRGWRRSPARTRIAGPPTSRASSAFLHRPALATPRSWSRKHSGDTCTRRSVPGSRRRLMTEGWSWRSRICTGRTPRPWL